MNLTEEQIKKLTELIDDLHLCCSCCDSDSYGSAVIKYWEELTGKKL